jgi:hypothetical protein
MPNKDSLVIQPNGEVVSYTDLLSDVIVFDEEKRQKLLQVLRKIPAILDVTKKLSEEKVYQAHFPPEVLKRIKAGSARLDNKGDSRFSASIRDVKTGSFIDNADLVEVRPELLSSLNELATQQTLADIVHRLEVIDEKITDVLQGQFNDRLAEIESGIQSYEQAVVASNPDLRRELIVSAIQQLNDGRNKLIKSTDISFINKLPRNRLGKFFSPHWDINKHIQSKAELVWKAAHAIIRASRYLVIAYSALNEPDSLRVSLEQVESEVKLFQEKMREIVNWLSPTSNWRESFMTISQGVLPNIHELDEISQKTIVVEFQPKEIAPPKGV